MFPLAGVHQQRRPLVRVDRGTAKRLKLTDKPTEKKVERTLLRSIAEAAGLGEHHFDSELELSFAIALKHAGINFQTQYQIDGVGHHFDFYLGLNLIVEIQGGIHSKGPSGHKGMGAVKGFHHINEAMIQGWHVLQFSADMLHGRHMDASIETVKRAIGSV